jgi:hypothetical protein
MRAYSSPPFSRAPAKKKTLGDQARESAVLHAERSIAARSTSVLDSPSAGRPVDSTFSIAVSTPTSGCRLEFRASRRRLTDYPRLLALVRRIHDLPGVAKTTRYDHILAHYYNGDWAVATCRGIVPEMPAGHWLSRAIRLLT